MLCLQKAGVRVGSDQVVVVMELLMFGEARFGVGEEENVACS